MRTLHFFHSMCVSFKLFLVLPHFTIGWSALICLPEVARKLPEGCSNFMVLGGVGYTLGVPFFVRNNNLDHAIWHLFVLAGSLCHWSGIYFYVTDYQEHMPVR
jgi:hemolysin III